MVNFKHLDAIGDYENMLKLTKDRNDIEAKYWNITALLRLGELNEALDKAQEYFKEFQGSEMYMKFINRYGSIYLLKGDLDQALEIYDQVLNTENLEISTEKAAILNNMGLIYEQKSEYSKAKNLYLESLEIEKKIGNPKDIAYSFNNIGGIHRVNGELDLALKYYQKAYELRKRMDNPHDIAHSLNNIGTIYGMKGLVNSELRYYKESLKIRKQLGNPWHIGMSLSNIGSVYYDKGDYEIAIDYFIKSLKYYKEYGNALELRFPLRALIKLYLEIDQIDSAKIYFNELEHLQSDGNSIIIFNYQFCKALILKKSNRLKDKIKAQEILNQLVNRDELDFTLKISSISELTELLIYEYKAYEEKEVQEELNHHLIKMYKLAQEQLLFKTVIHVLTLRSRLALINSEFDKAMHLLEQASLLSYDFGLDGFQDLIKDERDNLINKIHELKTSMDKSSIVKILRKLNLQRYIERVKMSVL